MAELIAYYLVLLAPLLANDLLGVKFLGELSDQNQVRRLGAQNLPAVVLTPRGQAFRPGFAANTRTRSMTVRIRILDRSPSEPEFPRSAENPHSVSAIEQEVLRLLATGKGRALDLTTPYLWSLGASPTTSDFDAWQGQPGQYAGIDIIQTADRLESWTGTENPQSSFALPVGSGV